MFLSLVVFYVFAVDVIVLFSVFIIIKYIVIIKLIISILKKVVIYFCFHIDNFICKISYYYLPHLVILT